MKLFHHWLPAVLCLLLAWRVQAQPAPLTMDFGTSHDRGTGLVVPSGGDGTLETAEVGGCMARRTTGESSSYLYVIIRDAGWTKGPVDAFVGMEIFDDRTARLEMQYDRAAQDGGKTDHYARAISPTILTGDKAWRTAWFHLPDLRLGHGQNHGADFRLQGRGLAVRRITVTTQAPAGWDPNQPIDADSLARLKVQRPAGMEVCFGNDASPADAQLYRAIGVSSIESYVDWAGVEPEPGRWDWQKWDEQVDVLQKARLQWVPFLIAGAAYATPLWFQRGPDSHVFRCLDHDRDSAVQSIFNPALRPRIEAFVRTLASHYGKSGVLESLLLGVSGIYGESIYPAGPEGGWTAKLTGDYHNHLGWWTADPLAVVAFRTAMQEKYRTIEALNAAWATSFHSLDDVKTFLPDRAPSDRARADFAGWYQQAMTDWSVFWVKTVREALPDAEIYLCTGGDGTPALGADFTAQAKAIAPFRAGIRITNEGSDYAHNFTLTREVATATRLYGTFCGFEPASGVTARGNVARIYNATASGARQLHCYNNNVVGGDPDALPRFRAQLHHLKPRTPRVTMGIYVPRETWELAPARVGEFHETARVLRDVADLDFVTRRSVLDGGLKSLRVLVLAGATVLEPEAAAAIERWVKDGGTLVTTTRPGETTGERLYDQSAWRTRLLVTGTTTVHRSELIVRDCENPPDRWALAIGGGHDDEWLTGAWHGAETQPAQGPSSNATMRWTGDRPDVLLPTQPGADYRLRLSVYVPKLALGGTSLAVRVNGEEVGRIDREGTFDLMFAVPAHVLTTRLAQLEMEVNAWKPSEHGGGRDQRALGMSVRAIEWTRAGAEMAPAGEAVLSQNIDAKRYQARMKKVGDGRTLSLPGLLTDEEALARVVASVLDHPSDGQLDRRFVTETDQGILRFDAETATITESPAP